MIEILYLVLFIASGLLLGMLFFRRLRLTRKDLIFQEDLREQEAQEEQAIDPALTEHEPPANPSGPSAKQLYAEAERHLQARRHDDAEHFLIQVLELDPSHLDAHHNLGMLYMKLERFPDAELTFSRLVNFKKDPIYYSNLGAALYAQQRLQEAAEAYENAIALDDRRAARLKSLGQVYFELGEDEKALHYFERAARRTPKDHDLKTLLADYYERLEMKEEALSALEALLKENPDDKELQKRIKQLKETKN